MFDLDIQDEIQNSSTIFSYSETDKWKTQVMYLMWLDVVRG